MQLEMLDLEFSICKAADFSLIDIENEMCFIANTDEEKSLVLKTESVPDNATVRDDGWKAFRIKGTLDFSLIGIVAKISALLAESKIGIFVVSTYNTDYIMNKKENFEKSVAVLGEAGYEVV